MARKLFSRVAVAALAIVLAACGSDDSDGGSGSGGSGSGGSGSGEGADQELVIAIGQDIPNMDIRLPGSSAAGHSAMRHITEPLVFFDAEGQNLEGVLATSWEPVDETTWRFELREGVTFHDGSPFNADSVVKSIADSIDPGFDVWYSYGTGGVLGPAEKVDEYTVDITTEVPAPLLPNLLTVVDMVPADSTYDSQNSEPIGTGPYQWVSWKSNDNLVLEKFDDYWGEEEQYTGLTFRIIPETSTRVQALLAGEVQGINSIGVEDIARIEGNADTAVAGAPQVQHVLISLRGDRPPLDNPLIREAMNYAVDKDLLTSTILEGIAIPADGFLPPGLPGAQSEGAWPYDVDKAKDLMEEAGYNGEEITMGVGAGRYAGDEQVGLAVAKMLEDAGFNIKYVATDYATFSTETEKRAGSEYDMFLSSWIADFADSAAMMDAFFSGEESPIPAFYQNEEYQAASAEAKAAQSDEERLAAIQKMEDIVWEDAAALFLYFPIENYGLSKAIQGFEPRVDGFFYWYGTSME